VSSASPVAADRVTHQRSNETGARLRILDGAAERAAGQNADETMIANRIWLVRGVPRGGEPI